MDTRVVVTGVGTITSIGLNHAEFWKNCQMGTIGTSKIELSNIELFKGKHGGQIKTFDFTKFHKQKSTHQLGRSTQLLIASVKEAISNSNINNDDINKLYIGTTMGEVAIDDTSRNYHLGIQNSEDLLRNNQLEYILNDTLHELEIKNCETLLLCNACSAGNYALVSAFECIKNNEADVIIVGGVDAFSKTAYYGFTRLGAVASEKCRPFDKNRDGMLVAEGAACLVLESEKHAIKRKASIIAEVVGYGISSDAFHINAPHPDGTGIENATIAALKYANINGNQIDYISAHGTGTIANDKIESRILNKVVGKVPISSIKSMLGHTMGAASAIESVACCLSIRDNIIPPTINYTDWDEECDVNCVMNNSMNKEVKYAMNNSYAFGGSNASIIFKEYEENN